MNTTNVSWKPEVLVDGKWSTNALRFATEKEAKASVDELMSRWWVPDQGRAAQSDERVNYKFDFELNKNIRIS